ncbi:MAG: aminopeptidase [Bacteroidales bacterium]|nr:aminopeptidase [Bacteroidales bacterium]
MSFLRTLVILLIGSLGTMVGAQTAVTDGVSHELAVLRKAQVSEVTYSLSFEIPSQKDIPVIGDVAITFDWAGGQEDLQIDFQGDITGPVVVNGQTVPTLHQAEHILIPAQSLKADASNRVSISFRSKDKALNRNSDYLYTLFVPDHARSVFPCFDQPDIKARYSLSLTLPEGWTAISNAPLVSVDGLTQQFGLSDLLPTYLFSFSAGRFSTQTVERDGRQLTALYRETDSTKVAQLATVFDQVALSLRWLEQYTGIPQPFQKYGIVILPGYQFGGMEHPGCIQLRDQTIFLGEHPTPDEEMNRLHLIAHETSHLWFGDLVTMRWFDDVWTKEVFANFMADKIAREQFPDINHDINFLKTHYPAALAIDRTRGTHPIQQPLDNLKNAGLLYGNIIYDKAPIMMRQLEEQMGEEPFRKGLQQYLSTYAFDNATWDDLIAILDHQNPQAGISAFDQRWVKHQGMPEVTVDINHGDFDPFLYGHYRLSAADLQWLLPNWFQLPATHRFAAMMYLYESFLRCDIDTRTAFQSLAEGVRQQDNLLVRSSCIDYLLSILSYATPDQHEGFERTLWSLGQQYAEAAQRKQVLQGIARRAVTPEVVEQIYRLWNDGSDPAFNERDYMRMAYHLAIVKPEQWQAIIDTQRQRLTNDDLLREFDFVSRGCNPDEDVQQALFNALLQRENRAIEPYAAELLALLNDPLREPFSNRYITLGLEVVEEVQRTGDIFFPLLWCQSLLGSHRSAEAAQLVHQFLSKHPDYPIALRNKILQAAYPILRE